MDIKEKKILSLTNAKASKIDQNSNSNNNTGDRSRRSINRSGRQVQFVMEDSQSIAISEKSPASAKMMSKVTKSSYFNHTQSAAPPSSPIDELLDLFPPTPVLLMQSREGSKTPGTKVQKDSQDADGSGNTFLKPEMESRSQLSPNFQRDERAKGEVAGQNHSASQIKASLPQSQSKRATSEISQHHQPEPSSRQQPSGVLRRPTTRGSRIDKRSALVAGHDAEQTSANKKSRLAGNKEGAGLGLLMPDLRSPNGSRISAVRGRQVSKGHGRKTVGWC